MRRRDMLGAAAGGAAATALLAGREAAAQEKVARAARGMVKVTTDQPGL